MQESSYFLINSRTDILNQIVIDLSIDEDIRIHAFILLLYYLQIDKLLCLKKIENYLCNKPNSVHKEIVYLLAEQLEEYNGIYID